MKQVTMFSSKTGEWATPQDFFDKLNAEFHFTLDPCADEQNHKCARYFTKNKTDLYSPGQGKLYSVILRMGATLHCGSGRRLNKPGTVRV